MTVIVSVILHGEIRRIDNPITMLSDAPTFGRWGRRAAYDVTPVDPAKWPTLYECIVACIGFWTNEVPDTRPLPEPIPIEEPAGLPGPKPEPKKPN
jgi:hypothetical protein